MDAKFTPEYMAVLRGILEAQMAVNQEEIEAAICSILFREITEGGVMMVDEKDLGEELGL
jgi:hypothetical protein